MFKEAKGGVVNRLEQHCRQKPVATTEAQPMPPIVNGIRLRTAPTLINETLKGFRKHQDIFSCLSLSLETVIICAIRKEAVICVTVPCKFANVVKIILFKILKENYYVLKIIFFYIPNRFDMLY